MFLTRRARATAGVGASEPIGTTRTIKVDGNLQTNSREVMRASALAGMGLGYSSEWLFSQELASGEVTRILPDWSAPVLPIHLVSPRERRYSAKVRAFAAHVDDIMV
jgi:DNA-binding transcriptional LysR family regulator